MRKYKVFLGFCGATVVIEVHHYPKNINTMDQVAKSLALKMDMSLLYFEEIE